MRKSLAVSHTCFFISLGSTFPNCYILTKCNSKAVRFLFLHPLHHGSLIFRFSLSISTPIILIAITLTPYKALTMSLHLEKKTDI